MNSDKWKSTEPVYTEQGYWFYVLKNGTNKIKCKSKKRLMFVREDIEKTLGRLNGISIKLKNPN